MSTTHMLDVHILGQADAIGPAMRAFQQEIETQFYMDTDDGDVVGTMNPPMPTKAPWPEGLHVGTNGAVFDANTYVSIRPKLRKIAEQIAQHEGIDLVVVPTWDLTGEAVSLIAARAGMKPSIHRLNDEQFEKLCGIELQEALNSDHEIDGIGDRILELFLTQKRGLLRALAPLDAAQKAAELDARWPAAQAHVPRPRLR